MQSKKNPKYCPYCGKDTVGRVKIIFGFIRERIKTKISEALKKINPRNGIRKNLKGISIIKSIFYYV